MFTTTKTKTTCSNHPDVTAVLYCRACKKFMCAKCEGHHKEFLGKDHEGSVVPTSSGDNNSDHPCCDKCTIHTEYPLDTLCKDCKGTLLSFPSHSTFFSLHFTLIMFAFLSSSLLYKVQVGRKPHEPHIYPSQ